MNAIHLLPLLLIFICIPIVVHTSKSDIGLYVSIFESDIGTNVKCTLDNGGDSMANFFLPNSGGQCVSLTPTADGPWYALQYDEDTWSIKLLCPMDNCTECMYDNPSLSYSQCYATSTASVLFFEKNCIGPASLAHASATNYYLWKYDNTDCSTNQGYLYLDNIGSVGCNNLGGDDEFYSMLEHSGPSKFLLNSQCQKNCLNCTTSQTLELGKCTTVDGTSVRLGNYNSLFQCAFESVWSHWHWWIVPIVVGSVLLVTVHLFKKVRDVETDACTAVAKFLWEKITDACKWIADAIRDRVQHRRPFRSTWVSLTLSLVAFSLTTTYAISLTVNAPFTKLGEEAFQKLPANEEYIEFNQSSELHLWNTIAMSTSWVVVGLWSLLSIAMPFTTASEEKKLLHFVDITTLALTCGSIFFPSMFIQYGNDIELKNVNFDKFTELRYWMNRSIKSAYTTIAVIQVQKIYYLMLQPLAAVTILIFLMKLSSTQSTKWQLISLITSCLIGGGALLPSVIMYNTTQSDVWFITRLAVVVFELVFIVTLPKIVRRLTKRKEVKFQITCMVLLVVTHSLLTTYDLCTAVEGLPMMFCISLLSIFYFFPTLLLHMLAQEEDEQGIILVAEDIAGHVAEDDHQKDREEGNINDETPNEKSPLLSDSIRQNFKDCAPEAWKKMKKILDFLCESHHPARIGLRRLCLLVGTAFYWIVVIQAIIHETPAIEALQNFLATLNIHVSWPPSGTQFDGALALFDYVQHITLGLEIPTAVLFTLALIIDCLVDRKSGLAISRLFVFVGSALLIAGEVAPTIPNYVKAARLDEMFPCCAPQFNALIKLLTTGMTGSVSSAYFAVRLTLVVIILPVAFIRGSLLVLKTRPSSAWVGCITTAILTPLALRPSLEILLQSVHTDTIITLSLVFLFLPIFITFFVLKLTQWCPKVVGGLWYFLHVFLWGASYLIPLVLIMYQVTVYLEISFWHHVYDFVVDNWAKVVAEIALSFVLVNDFLFS